MAEFCTDVPESIAGYYYQILLAIKELTKLSNDEDAVGIEKGADIRIFLKKEGTSSIEAKFYSKDFNRWSTPIVHTIYNFYNNLVESDEFLIFETNVSIDDDLIDKINEVTHEDNINDEYIEYICISIMKESLNKVSEICKGKKINVEQKFKSYLQNESTANEKLQFNKKITNKHYEHYYNKFKESSKVDFFGVNIDKQKVRTLIKKLKFRYKNIKEKYETIKELKKDIKKNLQQYAINTNYDEIIIKMLVDNFFETTLQGNELKLISLFDLKDELKKIKKANYEISLKYCNNKFIERIELLDDKVLEQINDSYDGLHEQNLFNRYVITREMILGELRACKYGEIEQGLKTYTLSNEGINTFDDLVKFITIFTVFNDIDFELIQFLRSSFSNLQIGNEKIVYKSHDSLSSKAVLNSFIRKTIDTIENNKDEATIIFSGEITGDKKLCETDVKNCSLLKITPLYK